MQSSNLLVIQTYVRTLVLPGRERKQIVSSINSLAHHSGRSLAEMRVGSNNVDQLFTNEKWLAADLAPDYKRNVKCKVLAGLRLAGINFASPISMLGCSARSAGLLNMISPEYAARLRGLSVWCYQTGIEFDDLTQAHADQYYSHAIKRVDLKAPHAMAITALRIFELCRQEHSDWPQVVLKRPKKPVRVACQRHEFADSFNDDLAALQDFLVDPPNRRSLDFIPMSLWAAKRRIARLRLAATDAASHKGVPVSDFSMVSDLITIENLNHAIDGSKARGNPERCSQHRMRVADFRIVGTFYAKLDADALNAMLNFYQHTKEPARAAAATIEILRALRNKNLVAALIALPSETMAELKKKPIITRHDVLIAERALAAALLGSAPIRPKNLASLVDGVHIHDRFEMGVRKVTVSVGAEDSKTAEPTTHELAEDVIGVLDDFRMLAFGSSGPINGALFPGRKRASKNTASLSKQLAEFMTEFLERNGVYGVRVTMHRFRAIAGYIYLSHHPEDYESVRKLLGHRNLDTTIMFYASVDAPDAQARNNGTRKKILADYKVRVLQAKKTGPSNDGEAIQ